MTTDNWTFTKPEEATAIIRDELNRLVDITKREMSERRQMDYVAKIPRFLENGEGDKNAWPDTGFFNSMLLTVISLVTGPLVLSDKQWLVFSKDDEEKNRKERNAIARSLALIASMDDRWIDVWARLIDVDSSNKEISGRSLEYCASFIVTGDVDRWAVFFRKGLVLLSNLLSFAFGNNSMAGTIATFADYRVLKRFGDLYRDERPTMADNQWMPERVESNAYAERVIDMVSRTAGILTDDPWQVGHLVASDPNILKIIPGDSDKQKNILWDILDIGIVADISVAHDADRVLQAVFGASRDESLQEADQGTYVFDEDKKIRATARHNQCQTEKGRKFWAMAINAKHRS